MPYEEKQQLSMKSDYIIYVHMKFIGLMISKGVVVKRKGTCDGVR